EFAGTTIFRMPERTVEANWLHGRVIDALATFLTKSGFTPKKSQAVDLCITDDSGSVAMIFEAKTDVDAYSIYGQLAYHSVTSAGARKFLVVPLFQARTRSA